MRSTVENAPLTAFSFAGLGAAMLGVIWAYHGWMNIASVAEEVRQPQRNLPLSLLGGVGTVIFLYLGANLAYHLVIPQGEMQNLKTTTVAAEFCLRLLGSVGAALASGAQYVSTDYRHPDTRFSAYQARLPGRAVTVCNPVRAAGRCAGLAIETN